jgi:hypothetical protein
MNVHADLDLILPRTPLVLFAPCSDRTLTVCGGAGIERTKAFGVVWTHGREHASYFGSFELWLIGHHEIALRLTDAAQKTGQFA